MEGCSNWKLKPYYCRLKRLFRKNLTFGKSDERVLVPSIPTELLIQGCLSFRQDFSDFQE